ncbi:MAG: hypothetical protein IKA87_00385 [Lentisphaeria bacterium]|nr:hypothetical protein [Lentisphaeria bacterium]
MRFFRSAREPFAVRREGELVVVENRYVKCVHDPAAAGGISEAIIKNGSGKSLFTEPQSFIIAITEHGAYHLYKAADADCRISEKNGNPVLDFRSVFKDSEGVVLEGTALNLHVEYTPWGEAMFRAEIDASRRIDDIGMVQIGSLYASGDMNCLALQESLYESISPYMGNGVKHYMDIAPSPHAAYESSHLPRALLMFRKGVEGFQMVLGDDLAQWDSIGGTLPGLQMGYVAWRENRKCYEIRFSAVDCRRDGQYLEGKLPFDFSLAFPFVREKMAPLVPCSGNMLHGYRGFENRWPLQSDIDALKDAGVSLMRLHNDGDSFDNGIFWRDADYPPYPADEMEKMDKMLAMANAAGIDVVPYFSIHEYHPEAPDFAENAEEWGRIAIEGDNIIPSYSGHGLFGYQMCLKTGWLKKRIDTIDEVLRKHAFKGVYYDWCSAKECLSPKHGRRHWDYRELIDFLSWSYDRVAEYDGAVYLHLTREPNIIAGNIASMVLTEEIGGSIVSPFMFSPHAHFMNVTSRQVCCMLPGKASEADHRRYALCALLHHATVSMGTKPYTDFYAQYRKEFDDVVNYAHHTAPGEGMASVGNDKCGIAAYWNNNGEVMVFLVNLSEAEEECSWRLSLPVGNASGDEKVAPLSLKVVKFTISEK